MRALLHACQWGEPLERRNESFFLLPREPRARVALCPLLGQSEGICAPPCSPPPPSPPGLPELRTPPPRPALERSTRQLGVCQSACFPATSKNISPPTPPAAATSLSTEDPLPACPPRQGEPRGGSWSQLLHRHRGYRSSRRLVRTVSSQLKGVSGAIGDALWLPLSQEPPGTPKF